MPDTSLILNEIRGLRSQLTEHAERLASIEAILHTIAGNGQPGRLGIIERTVERLERTVEKLVAWRYWFAGAAAGLGLAGEVIGHILLHH